MSDDPLFQGFPNPVRLFPLPNLVLFPGVVQGLHIFEPRYRQMTADALASDSLIALVLLSPGWEEDDPTPAVESVACLARIVWHEKLKDGRYNLRVRGVCRVRVGEELQNDRLYRTARVDVLGETAPTASEELKALRQRLADAVLPRFEDDGPNGRQLRELFHGDMTLGQVCDVLAYAMPLPPEFKQAMLVEPDAGARATALADAFLAAAARADRKFPPEFSPN